MDAEDICQMVFEQLLTHPSIQPGKEKAWLMRTCANRCKNLLRSHWWSRTTPLEDVHATPEQENYPVKEAVMALRPEYRAVVYLYYYEGNSTQEIGKLLGISQSAVTPVSDIISSLVVLPKAMATRFSFKILTKNTVVGSAVPVWAPPHALVAGMSGSGLWTERKKPDIPGLLDNISAPFE